VPPALSVKVLGAPDSLLKMTEVDHFSTRWATARDCLQEVTAGAEGHLPDAVSAPTFGEIESPAVAVQAAITDGLEVADQL